MEEKKTICIYGASSDSVGEIYKKDAFATGSLIARAGWRLVCGGGRGGLMAAAIEGALSEGGTAIGVLPSFMIEKEWQHPALTQIIETPGMHERKATMARLSGAVIAFPGGYGTMEELLEIITWRQLNLFHGRVVILNTDGFFDSLTEMFLQAAEKGFMRDSRHLWDLASSPEEAVRLAMTPLEEEK